MDRMNLSEQASYAALMSTWIFKHSKKLKNNCLFRLFPIFCRVTQKCFTCFYALRPLRVSLNKIYIYIYCIYIYIYCVYIYIYCIYIYMSYSFVIPTRRKHQRQIKNTATGLKTMRQIQIQKCVCLQPGDYLAKPLMFRHGFSTPDESSFPSV